MGRSGQRVAINPVRIGFARGPFRGQFQVTLLPWPKMILFGHAGFSIPYAACKRAPVRASVSRSFQGIHSAAFSKRRRQGRWKLRLRDGRNQHNPSSAAMPRVRQPGQGQRYCKPTFLEITYCDPDHPSIHRVRRRRRSKHTAPRRQGAIPPPDRAHGPLPLCPFRADPSAGP